jgi:hypothetical protein
MHLILRGRLLNGDEAHQGRQLPIPLDRFGSQRLRLYRYVAARSEARGALFVLAEVCLALVKITRKSKRDERQTKRCQSSVVSRSKRLWVIR